MSANKVVSAKNAVVKMLAYYNQALIEAGCEDPKQEMATELAKAIALSEAQTKYLVEESADATILMLQNIGLVLKGVKANNYTTDKKTIDTLLISLETIAGTISGVVTGKVTSND